MQAENTIRRVIDSTQAKLDAAALAARTESVRRLRAAVLEGVAIDSDAYDICAVVSQTLTVGREDGYPLVQIPESTRELVKRAVAAGILEARNYIRIGSTNWYSDMSGWTGGLDEDFAAWTAARTYRRQNT